MDLTKQIFLNISDFFQYISKKLRGLAQKTSTSTNISLYSLEKNNWQNVRPCFVLSTGRCGTKLSYKLLQSSNKAIPFQNPTPELIRASKKAYEEIYDKMDLYKEVVKSCREELILFTAKRDKIYIETNNRITFFAPAIKKVFPKAIFIHLIRHPGAFVRSGIRREWYSGKHEHDIGRIVPTDKKKLEKWERYNSIQKIGWLWNETNNFIENFLEVLSPQLYLQIKSEELFNKVETVKEIYDFLNLNDFKKRKVASLLKRPVNKQYKGHFPYYKDWNEEMKKQLKNLTPLAKKYRYKL